MTEGCAATSKSWDAGWPRSTGALVGSDKGTAEVTEGMFWGRPMIVENGCGDAPLSEMSQVSDALESKMGPAFLFDLELSRLRPAAGEGPPTAARPILRLELGDRWTPDAVDQKIKEVRRSNSAMGDRLAAWAELLIGTPTQTESSLPPLDRHEVRVRLASLDCITLIYTGLALARATDFESFIAELVSLRYGDSESRGVDNDPLEGNFLDFACDSLLTQAVRRGCLADVTTEFLERESDGVELSTWLGGHSRDLRFDPLSQTVRPFFGEREFSRLFIRKEQLASALSKHLRRGDIVLASKGSGLPTLIHHCFVASTEPSAASYIHASLNGYFYSPLAYAELARDPLQFVLHQCGVSRGAGYVADDFIVKMGARSLYPYYRDVDRTVDDAISHTFSAALVLRLQPTA